MVQLVKSSKRQTDGMMMETDQILAVSLLYQPETEPQIVHLSESEDIPHIGLQQFLKTNTHGDAIYSGIEKQTEDLLIFVGTLTRYAA